MQSSLSIRSAKPVKAFTTNVVEIFDDLRHDPIGEVAFTRQKLSLNDTKIRTTEAKQRNIQIYKAPAHDKVNEAFIDFTESWYDVIIREKKKE